MNTLTFFVFFEAINLRVLHYNILNGFNASDASASTFAEYLDQSNIDILMLNEYRSSPALDRSLADLGYVYSAINTFHEALNRAAIFSRVAIDKIVSLPAQYRLVWIVIKGTNYVSYHASPAGVQEVRAEVESILNTLQEKDRVVVCGDLNSLSIQDLETIKYRQLMGTLGVLRYTENESMSFAALEMFQDAGFKDNRGPGLQHTVPTTLYREHELGATLRLDYVLSRNIKIEDVKILRGEPFDWLSDHFPLIFTVQQ